MDVVCDYHLLSGLLDEAFSVFALAVAVSVDKSDMSIGPRVTDEKFIGSKDLPVSWWVVSGATWSAPGNGAWPDPTFTSVEWTVV